MTLDSCQPYSTKTRRGTCCIWRREGAVRRVNGARAQAGETQRVATVATGEPALACPVCCRLSVAHVHPLCGRSRCPSPSVFIAIVPRTVGNVWRRGKLMKMAQVRAVYLTLVYFALSQLQTMYREGRQVSDWVGLA